MYIRVTKNSAGQKYFHLVESFRDEGKVRQRILLSLGRAEEGKLEALSEALAKHIDITTAHELAKTMSVESTYVLGLLLVLKHLFEVLGIDAALRVAQESHPRLEFSLEKVIFALVAARFLRPTSKLQIYEELAGKFYPAMVEQDMELQHIYRAVDLLAEHKEAIEKALFWKDKDLLNSKVDVVLYDLTTLRFESTREDLGSLRRFGFSKEKCSDCTQVVLGLLVEPNGTPIGFEVYPGNTFEGATLKDIVGKMREKYNIGRFIFVADRALFSHQNLEDLRKANGEFVVGMRLVPVAKKRPELYDKSKFTPLKKDDDSVLVLETTHGGDRCIVNWSRERAERDRKVRDDILEKIRKKLTKKTISSKAFVTNSNYTYFLNGLDEGTPALDETKIAEAAKRDGFFSIITNVKDKTPSELWSQYRQLWIIEDSFGELKGTMKARPIFHWTDDRIRGHLMMCFLALACESRMTIALRAANTARDSKAIREGVIGDRPLSAAQTLKELCEVRAIPVQLKNQTIWLRTDINGHVAKLFASLKIRIPPKVLQKVENVVAQTQGTSLTT